MPKRQSESNVIKKIQLGIDFDGVIAYNPFRLIRAPITFVKSQIFGKRKLKFYYPKNRVEKLIWKILHDSSILPARGINFLIELVENGTLEVHIISGRYNYLEDHLLKWLNKYKLKKYFKTININRKDRQPHLFKEELIKARKVDFFIEDNLDIVNYLSHPSRNYSKKVKIFWIYNLIDRFKDYPYKYPYLEKALRDLK